MDFVDPLHYPEWDEFVHQTPGGTIFHTSFWARVLNNTYNYQPRYLAQIHDGKLTTLIPVMEVRSFLTGKRGVSLPFTDYCEPIVTNEQSWQDAMASLLTFGGREKWDYLELRGGSSLMGSAPCSSHYYRHHLALAGDIDQIYARLKNSTRRNVKKAEREGVVIARENTDEALRIFYAMHCGTRKKHGVPPQPFSFFQQIFDNVLHPGHGQIMLARHQGKAVAAAIYLHFNDMAMYKYGASDSRYLHIRPNDLLMWEAIKWYCSKGYAEFCFGRTEPENEGLRQFKGGWGAVEDTIRYYKYDFKQHAYVTEKNRMSGRYNTLFNMIPIPLLRAAGALLYKHMG